eukprot:3853759-Pyramimonas_sp.AAC.1
MEGVATGRGPASGLECAGPPGPWPGGGARDIFPLPGRGELVGQTASGRGRVRLRQWRFHYVLVNEAVDGLNWLAGAFVGSSTTPVTAVQLDVAQRIDGQVNDIVQPMRGVELQPPHSALRELMRGRSPYLGGPPEDVLAPCRPGLPSLPGGVAEAPAL